MAKEDGHFAQAASAAALKLVGESGLVAFSERRDAFAVLLTSLWQKFVLCTFLLLMMNWRGTKTEQRHGYSTYCRRVSDIIVIRGQLARGY